MEVYPMGDRGGTATGRVVRALSGEFIRWEIGEEPQPDDGQRKRESLSDGRSGRNRNADDRC